MLRVAFVDADPVARVVHRVRAVVAASPDEAEAIVFGANSPDAVQQAARSRKHVLLLAPLGNSVEAADRLLTECSNAAIRLMVANPERFHPSVRTIKSTLDSGKLGQAGLLRIHRWEPRSTLGAGEPPTASGSNTGPRSSTQGAESRTLGAIPPGAALWHRAAEEIDLARWIFGGRPTEICVVGRDDSYLQFHLGFPEGGMALIDCAATLPAGPGYTSRSLIASTGAAYSDDHHNMQLAFRGGAPSAVRTTEGEAGSIAVLQEFVDLVTKGREPSCTPAEARDAVMIAEAALNCLTSGLTARLTGDRYELV